MKISPKWIYFKIMDDNTQLEDPGRHDPENKI